MALTHQFLKLAVSEHKPPTKNAYKLHFHGESSFH
jgi:hypothetical protein